MANFLDLPSELRNKVYELCLLHQGPIGPWTGCNPWQQLTPELLRANKQIHREASSFFYAQNCFDLCKTTPEGIAVFLEKIGRLNAEYIEHICVDFPSLCDLEIGNVTFEEDSSGIFVNIQNGCTNLRMLTTSPESTNTMMLKLDALDYLKIVIEALALVNARFRAISSLQDIVIEMYENGPSEYLKKAMEVHGWTVRELEYVEDWDSNRSYGEDVWDSDYDYGGVVFVADDDDDDDDDYDIDNDSDFWRRAGD